MEKVTLNLVMRAWYDANREELSRHQLDDISTYCVMAMPELEHTKTFWGLMEVKSGEIICEPRFTHVGKFVNGFAPCEINEKVGYVKADGTYLIEPTADYKEALEVFGGVCRLKTKDDKIKLYSCNTEKFLTEEEFTKVEVVGEEDVNLGMKFFKVWNDEKKCGLIREDGKWVVTFDFNGFFFIDCNLVVANKATGGQCLLSLETNKTLIYDAKKMRYIGKDKHISYYDISKKAWVLAKIVDNKLEVLIKSDGYSGYEWLEDSDLVMCKISKTEHECFDIFNVVQKEMKAKDVERITVRMSNMERYWFFESAGFVGLLADDGKTIMHALAEDLDFISHDLIRAISNGFFGIFSLSQKRWVILPNFITILGPDKAGNFRCLSEVFYGKKGRKVEAWRYMRSNGTLITREMFAKAGEFEHDYARVETLDKRICRLYENGRIEEEKF